MDIFFICLGALLLLLVAVILIRTLCFKPRAVAAPLPSDTDFDAERLGHIISDFVRSLSARRQFIFISRYYVADSIDAIAADLRLSRSTVHKELAAIRDALKEKLESEGYSI